MIYHYTSLDAFKSILKDAKTQSELCFWATRYDCFADKEEYKLGVETAKRLLPEIEKDLQADRKIANLFDWDKIEGNANLPYPYVVSFTSRPDNPYLWKYYAKPNGIVLAVDDSIMPASPLVRLTHCVYADSTTDEKLVNTFRDEYCIMGYSFLLGPKKNVAFHLLENHPQLFVKLIAMGLLCYVAPRIKNSANYSIEDEIRAIISIPTPCWNKKVEGHENIIEKLGFPLSILKKFIAEEYSRKRRDGSELHYRKLNLPINLLRAVFVKESDTEECVKAFLRGQSLNIPVSQI